VIGLNNFGISEHLKKNIKEENRIEKDSFVWWLFVLMIASVVYGSKKRCDHG